MPKIVGDNSVSLSKSLQRMEMFGRISELDLYDLAAAAQVWEFEDGEILMVEGVPGNCAYVLLDGQAVVYKEGVEIARRRAGDCLGELSLLDSAVRCASVKARGHVRAVRLARTDFLTLLERPSFVQNLLSALAEKIREASNIRVAEQRDHDTLREAFAEYLSSDA